MSSRRIASGLATELALDAGFSPREILLDHYASRSRTASERDACVRLAFVGEEFFNEIAEATGGSLAEVVEFFKDSRVLKFFNKIGWSFKKFYNILRRGYQFVPKKQREVMEQGGREAGFQHGESFRSLFEAGKMEKNKRVNPKKETP